MAITLAAAALGSIVKLNVGEEPREFYVHQHGIERTILVQRYVEGFVEYDTPWPNGYLGGPIDDYLNITYASQLDKDVLAVSIAEFTYEAADAAGSAAHISKKVAERNVFMLCFDDYAAGGAPLAATKGDGTPQAYWTASVETGYYCYYVNSEGVKKSQPNTTEDCVRPCMSLPNNTIVNDDGTLTVVSLDSTALLPCIKY